MTPGGRPEETDPPEDDELLAAEHALGVLDAEARRAAEARAGRDPEFAAKVFAWATRLAPLIEELPPVEPRPELRDRILAAAGVGRGASAARVAGTASPSPAPAPSNENRPGRAPWLAAWAAAATAVAAAALLYIGWFAASGPGGRPASPFAPTGPGRPTLVATLGLKDGGGAAVTVAYDPNRGTLYAAPDAQFSIPKARAAELWLVPADGKPRPMGVIDPEKPATMPMPPEFRDLAREKAALALSIEPPGGAPGGAPTGPVIAAGTLSAV